ncbi:prepilin-type N-terminal cleavage/methylation domain-containing protein [Gehongia tenuis]|uniref:Prepilin-type N-terminal cleavage/methylation domain-containing protein n=1 Tax=Gehongia tenuis TaxID=2763655 RepID=A0A926HPU6_9FIRM|nr:prepilin-type N-terminal cleavage/methylation domain-containing protein [Gehongia tenuis]MBC8531065.1 prepilin-type N-terminal cleavage/methylation domain-containing protein [Gehongia tenuis]
MNVRRRQWNRGFTLVEAITVLVIIAIMAAVAIPVAANFIERSEQNARNETARSIFMASQSALTVLYGNGHTLTPDGTVDLAAVQPALAAEEVAQNNGNIGYLALRMDGSDRDFNALYRLIGPYIHDKIILNHAILIEYNTLNGNVLSAFYSDRTQSLGYGGADYNVLERTVDRLRSHRTGYYGVEGTGKAEPVREMGDVEVRLADYMGEEAGYNINGGSNYGLLTVECMLPESREDDYFYDITLKPQRGMEETLRVYEKKTEGALSVEEAGKNLNLDTALQMPFEQALPDGSSRRLAMYLETRGTREVLVLVLDGVYPGMSIRDNFPSIQPGSLVASFTASDGTHSKTASSQSCHAYFAGESETAEGTVYSVASVRHLNNIRYRAGAAFMQIQDIKVEDYAEKPILWEPIEDAASTVDSGFKGTYAGGDEAGKYAIYDLSVSGERAGLFLEISEGARVEWVKLNYTDGYKSAYAAADEALQNRYYIHGQSAAGAIAAVNRGEVVRCSVMEGRVAAGSEGLSGGIVGQNEKGTVEMCTAEKTAVEGQKAGGMAAENSGDILKCTVKGTVTAAEKGGLAGGITGENTENGRVKGSFVAADVTAEKAAGGVAGLSRGTLEYCEVGTASAEVDGEGRVIGVPYFGANEDQSGYNYKPDGGSLDNNIFAVRVTGSEGLAGGIAGEMNKGSMYYCVNAAAVTAGKGEAGGLAGKVGNGGTGIQLCYNAGDVLGAKTAGGIAAVNDGKIDGNYNTGLVNAKAVFNTDYGYGTYIFEQDPYPDALSGGIVGRNNNYLAHSYNAQYVGNIYGGAIGINEGVVEDCAFLNNMRNLTDLCLLDDGGTTGRVEGVTMMDSKTLRTHDFGGAMWKNEREGGVGPHEYIYPYFSPNSSECALSRDFHRTPYQPLLQDLAKVWIEEKEGDLLEVHFMTRVRSFELLLETDQGGILFPVDAPSLEKCERFAFTPGETVSPTKAWVGLDMADSEYTAICPGYSVQLSPRETDYLEGYRYEHVLLIRWPKTVQPGDEDLLPEGAASCQAFVYGYGESSASGKLPLAKSNVVKTEYTPGPVQPEDMVLVEQSGEKTAAVHFWVPQGKELTDMKFVIEYAKGKPETLPLSPKNLQNAYVTDDLNEAVQPGNAETINPEHGQAARYPFYQKANSAYEGYDEFVLVLLWDDIGNEGYNGLGKGEFRVIVEYTFTGGERAKYASPWFEGVQK